MKQDKNLGPRLCSAIPFLQSGEIVADIGSDHAYLPILLVREGIARHAVACDIGTGPIERAREHIRAAEMEEKIDTLQTDGLHGVERWEPTAILIFGMGGELIAKILSEAAWVKKTGIRLILQPMSHAEILRAWLCDNGFAITGETVTKEKHFYQTLCATYQGAGEDYTAAELLVGKEDRHTNPDLYRALIAQKIRTLEKICREKRKSGSADLSGEVGLTEAMRTILQREKEKNG